MNKQEASSIINKDLGKEILNPKNKGNVKWATINNKKDVYWINIHIDSRISNEYHLILNDEEKIEGVTVKYNDVMGEMGIEIEQEEEIDEDFVRKILKFGMIWELVCAILAFVGGALLMMRQNYNMVLIGCSAAIVGLGGLLLSTLLGAIALYLTFQSRPEFGIAEQDESW